MGRGAGELSSPGRASGASLPSEPSREALRLSRGSRADPPVGAAPRFELPPQSQDALEGTKVIFKCQGNWNHLLIECLMYCLKTLIVSDKHS